ncbi:trichohyalin-like isoform X2 [Megalobrama amblycephala]|uniref:trichohyalin-like isoform X2 n=1 Tax=Megalobrama amblycephala TaxID=75352 RepID=UPI00201459AA|nr:trichohyalin-like isoform X2 [Megalobrama amblycephala]
MAHRAANSNRNDDTFKSTSESTGYTKDLRFILLGGDEDLMDRTCDIILRKRAERAESDSRHRKGHVCGRKISVVKTPSTWMSDVTSCCCFSSRVKSIEDQMPDYASLVFPGPHAFLLVTDNRELTGREQYLLKAIAKLFSKEALDYAMLLIIGRNEPKGISSVSKYVRRVYTLEDNEQSVQSLFVEIERMTQNKESTFFIQPSYENLMKKAFLSWEQETQKLHAQEVTALKERLRRTESDLKKEMETLRQLMLDTVIQLKKDKYSQEQNQQGASSDHEDLLFKEYEVCSETTLRNMISTIIDDFTEREHKLKEQLDTCRNMCSSMVDDHIRRESQMKSDIEKLQRELEQLKLKEGEWEQKQDRETQCMMWLEKERRRKEKELESKERGTAKKEQDLQPSGDGEEFNLHSNVELTSHELSKEQCRSLGEGERELKCKDEDSPDSVSLDFEGSKPVRRNSNQFTPPNMTESDHGPLNKL